MHMSIIEGLARRNRETHAMLAEVGEEDQRVLCIDSVTIRELPWHEVRHAREQELTCLRGLGVYEKVDEREAIVQYQVTPVDSTLIDTNKAFEEEPMQIRSRVVARDFKSDSRPSLYARTPPLEALEAIILTAANHEATISILHIDMSRPYFAERLVLIRLPAEDRLGADAGEIGLLKKRMYSTLDAASNWVRDGREHIKSW